LRRSILMTPEFFLFFRLLQPISFGTFKAVIRSAHDCAPYPAAEVLYLRKIDPDCDWACMRLLCEAIQASAATSVSNLLTVVGLMSWIEIFTPNPPAASGTIS
jgi:hypothetical protein